MNYEQGLASALNNLKDIEIAMPHSDLSDEVELDQQSAIGDSTDSSGALKRYGFRLGEFNFLLQASTFSEVLDSPVISRIPNTPHWCLGLINVRGNLLPVYDLAPILNSLPLANQDLSESDPRYTLIIDKGEWAVGITLQDLPLYHRMNQAKKVGSLPGLPPLLTEAVEQVYLADHDYYLELNHRLFFQKLIASHTSNQ